jgi:hypothetical protein
LKNLARNLNSASGTPWDSIPSFVVTWGRPGCGAWQNAPHGTFSHLFPASTRNLQLDPPSRTNVPKSVHPSQLYINIPPNVFNRLTSFILTCDWGAYTILGMLQHCANLETLDIQLGRDDFDWTNPQGAFALNIT